VTKLLWVELRRDLSRRLVRVLLALAVVGCVVVGVVVFATAEDYSDQEAAAQRELERELVEMCEDNRAATPTLDGETVPCEEMWGTTGAESDPRPYLTDLWSDDNVGDNLLWLPATLLFLMALVAGASMLGAEWKVGTVATQLTWEPRRIRVLVAKVIAAGVIAAVVALLLLVLFCVALWPAVALRGVTEGADAAWFRQLAGAILRMSALTGVAATLGVALSALVRNTAAAIGVAFAYLVVAEPILRAVRPKWDRWYVGENINAFVLGGTPDDATFTRSGSVAAGTLLGYTAMLILLAIVAFRSRDIAGAT
jgi:hypothetical protein